MSEGQLTKKPPADYGPLFNNQVVGPTDHTKSIEEAFRRFHRANPGIYAMIVRLARQAKARGHGRWSINGIFEVLRWEIGVNTDEESPTLSNNYRSRYARLVMEQEPDLEGFFETRELRSP